MGGGLALNTVSFCEVLGNLASEHGDIITFSSLSSLPCHSFTPETETDFTLLSSSFAFSHIFHITASYSLANEKNTSWYNARDVSFLSVSTPLASARTSEHVPRIIPRSIDPVDQRPVVQKSV